jgi:predicted RNase H-like HicB family nuclease
MRRASGSVTHLKRPFDAVLLARAKAIASTYTLVIEPCDDVGYLGRTIELPLAMSDGKTIAKCARRVIAATTLAIATMLERDEQPPAAARDARNG